MTLKTIYKEENRPVKRVVLSNESETYSVSFTRNGNGSVFVNWRPGGNGFSNGAFCMFSTQSKEDIKGLIDGLTSILEQM